MVHTPGKYFIGSRSWHTNRGNFDCGLWILYDAAWLELGRVCLGLCACLAFLNDRVKLLAYRIFDPIKNKATADLTPQIAKRAYELYEEGGNKDGRSVQDWENAEKEIRKDETNK